MLIDSLLFVSNLILLGYYLVLYVFYLLLLTGSLIASWIQPRRAHLFVPEQLLASETTPPVTLLVPAHNEEAGIVESVRSLLGLAYPRLEVIVINDGSTDRTLEELIRSFSAYRADVGHRAELATELVRGVYLSTLDPRLVVIDKVGGGKSDALNSGLNFCRTPWVCTVDADSILEEDALVRVLRPAIEDGQVVANSGIVRIANGCRVAGGRVVAVGLPRERLAMFQVVEYLRGFLQGRVGWSWINGLLIISGAFGVFRTDVLRAVGGYARETVAEDMEVVVRIHQHLREQRQAYRVQFVPDPVCWTEVPTTFASLARQRRRWQRGLVEVLSQHRRLFFRRRMGVLGWLVLPYFFLEVIGPVVEVWGLVYVPVLWWLGLLSQEILMLYLVLAFLLGTTFSLWGVVIEEFTYRRYTSWRDLGRLTAYAMVEHVGFHQLTLWWRLRGLYDAVRRRRGWGAQRRAGFRRWPRPDAASRF